MKQCHTDSEWALAATICPSRRKLEKILEKGGIKRGAGWGIGRGNYIITKKFVFRHFNLSGREYDKAIKIITDYLRM